MGIISVESQAAHVGRLRRLATQTMNKGMSCSVRGEEIRGVLAALDTATERADRAELALTNVVKPRRGRPPKSESEDGSITELLAACAEVLSDRHPEFWGQPLDVALKSFCSSQGTDFPDAWGRLIAGVQ